jgi:SAM-dependent methyltransferase
MSLNHDNAYNRQLRQYLLSVASYARDMANQPLVERACPVCGRTDLSRFAFNGFFNYDRCNQCTLVFMNPTIPEECINQGFNGEDELLMQYFKLMIKFKQHLRPQKVDPTTDGQLKDIYHYKKKGRLLDVGCSVGDFLHKAKHIYSVEGVEINPHTAAVAEKKFKIHRDDLAQLDLKPIYDVVTLNQILYGVPSPLDLLNQIAGVLKKDGILYINTPNSDSMAVQLYGGRCNHLYGYTTQQVFNRQSLTRLAERTGFKVVSFRTEWLDIYLTDLMVFLSDPKAFIHRRNAQLPDYADRIRAEEQMLSQMNIDLGERGNYFVSVLMKHD